MSTKELRENFKKQLHDVLEANEYELISYTSVNRKMTLKCKYLHTWNTQPVHIVYCNKLCEQCNGKFTMPSKDKAMNIIYGRGGKLHSEIKNIREPIEVECQYRHRWITKSTCINAGDWCPACSNNCPIRARDKFYETVSSRGGRVIGNYVDTHTKVHISCEHGHEWLATPRHVTSTYKQWCPVCTGQCPIQSMNKFCNIVATKGGKIKGDYYNTNTKILLECDKGHEWNVKPSSIINDTWCPHCNKSKGEMNIMLTLKKYNISYVEQYPLEEYLFKKKYDFLIQYDNKYYFIEYDGEQHFEHNVFFFKTEEEFKMRQQIDIIKNQVAIMLGYGIIRIDYNELNNVEQHIINALNIGQQQYYSTPSMYYHMNDTVDDKLWMEHVKTSYWDYLKSIGY